MGGPWFVRRFPAHRQARARRRGHGRRERRVRGLGLVRDPDGHADRVGSAPAVPHSHRHRVARLLLVVQRRFRLYLPGAVGGYDVERVGVDPFQNVGQHVAVAVEGRDEVADVGTGRGVLGYAERSTRRLRTRGLLLATSGFGDPVPELDQSLWPSSLSARTCTL